MKKKIKEVTRGYSFEYEREQKETQALEYPFRCQFKQKKVSSGGDKDWYEDTYENKFLKITTVSSYPDITSIHNFQPGDKAFLVWVEYSTGCSLGQEIRREVTPVALLKDRTDAEKLKAKESFWKAPRKDNEEYSGAYFVAKDGQKVHFPHAPWSGYFNQVNEIHITEVTIEGEECFLK